jgi:dihydroflavonol-4-reductase
MPLAVPILVLLLVLVFQDADASARSKVAYVTGATGCVGRNLVDDLQKDNWDIVVLHRRSSDLSRLEGCDVKTIEVDLHDAASVRRSLRQGIDAIFHVAANTSHYAQDRQVQQQDNVLATRNLVEAALEHSVGRFIFTSTGATLPFHLTDKRLAEQIPNSYVRTKRLAELEVYQAHRAGLDVVLLHPAIVVGPYDYNSYSQIFTQIGQDKMKWAFPGTVSFCDARDVSRAHLNAYYSGQRCERYVLGGPSATWLEFFQKVQTTVAAHSTTQIAVVSRGVLKGVAIGQLVQSWFTGKRPLLTPELVDLLGQEYTEVSEYERYKAESQIDYAGYNRSLDDMIEACNSWLLREGRL